MAMRPVSDSEVRRHLKIVSDTLADQVEGGYAPWMRSFDGTETPLPIGMKTNDRVRGHGAVWLAAVATENGWRDPRWGTFDTVRERGGTVRRGQKATVVPFWSAKTRQIRVSRVFNAQQCRGLDDWIPDASQRHWGLHMDWADRALATSGAELVESPQRNARYDPHADRIELPPEREFAGPEAYLRTALHELGHWTGHPDRLARRTHHSGTREGVGSEAWAREELRAEIASMLIGDRLQLGHDPERHAGYRPAWVRILRDRPREIAAATHEAQTICDCVAMLARKRMPVWPRRREQSRDDPFRDRIQGPSR